MRINAVSVNDTQHYNIRDEHKPLIKEVRTVYIYQPDSCTHLCELTPSYELHYLYTYLVLADNVDDDLAGELDQAYCYENTEDVTYMHCSSVQRMSSPPPKDCGEYESMDDASEHLRGNCPF